MNTKSTILLLIAALVLMGCAPGPNTMENIIAPSSGDLAGFWLGLWHGMISFITFIISLFNDNVSVYEVHNSGGWYDFGFVLGAGILGGSASRSSR